MLTLLLCGGWCLMGEAAVSAKVTAASCQSICYQEATDAREAAVRAAAKKKLQDLSAWQTAYDTALDAVNAAADTNIETLAQANFDKATKQLTADAAIATANAARAKAVAGFQATVDQETKKSEAAQKKLKHAYDKEAKAAKLKAKLDGDVAVSSPLCGLD